MSGSPTSQDASQVKQGRLKPFLLGLLLSVLATIVALGFAEAVLHLVDYPPKQTNHQRLFVEYDSIRGWRNIPGAEGRYITEEYDVALKYNSRGMRGPEHAYRKPPGTYRIVILGDSFIEGYAVPLERRVSELLQQRLSRAGRPRVEVIALGTAGYSTDQELLWLEQEGMRYEPDVVVAMFYANDVWYNARPTYWRGAKPLFVFDGDTLVLTNVPVPRTELDAQKSRKSLRDVIEENSKLYWIAAGAVKRQPRLHGLVVRWGLAEVPPEMVLDAGDRVPVPAEFNVYRTAESAEVRAAWRTTQALLARMQAGVQEAGARLLVFFIPQRGDIYTQEAAVRQGSGRAAGWDPLAVARKFQAICTAEQLVCLDPSEQFRDAAIQGGTTRRLYYRNDWHWNARGHALAADILAGHIESLTGWN